MPAVLTQLVSGAIIGRSNVLPGDRGDYAAIPGYTAYDYPQTLIDAGNRQPQGRRLDVTGNTVTALGALSPETADTTHALARIGDFFVERNDGIKAVWWERLPGVSLTSAQEATAGLRAFLYHQAAAETRLVSAGGRTPGNIEQIFKQAAEINATFLRSAYVAFLSNAALRRTWANSSLLAGSAVRSDIYRTAPPFAGNVGTAFVLLGSLTFPAGFDPTSPALAR